VERRNRNLVLALPLVVAASVGSAPGGGNHGAQDPGLVRAEFIFETGPVASVHASTIVATSRGLVAAWFGGTREGANDVGIWLSSEAGGRWTPPREVATGLESDGTRYPCWNPVLFKPSDGMLRLFYKVGPNPREWWGMVRASKDDGLTWSEARRLPNAILGPVKNKPVQLASGALISPSSTEAQSADRQPIWRVHFELTNDLGQNWTRVSPAASTGGPEVNAIQPSILTHRGGRLQAVGRTRSGRVFETWSADGGRTWSPLALMILPNPNAGIDALTLRDGRHLMVYNHTSQGRSPLNVAVSEDGAAWAAALALEREPGEYSYPAVIQTADGLVHITYTWRRQRIKHVVVDPDRLKLVPMPDGRWPD